MLRPMNAVKKKPPVQLRSWRVIIMPISRLGGSAESQKGWGCGRQAVCVGPGSAVAAPFVRPHHLTSP